MTSLWLAISSGLVFAQSTNNGEAGRIQIVEIQGTVEVLSVAGPKWLGAQKNQILHPGDRLRTGENSRAALLWCDQSVLPVGASTEIEILRPQSASSQSGLHLIRGIVSFFHRDKPGQIQIITRGAIAGVEGTEFAMTVDATDKTTVSVVDGKVRFGGAGGVLLLTNGQQAAVELGRAPMRTGGFIANNLLQWCFYYPAVLDLDDLPLTAEEQKEFGPSLAAYRTGSVATALDLLSKASTTNSDTSQIYYAALLLSAGEVEKAQDQLSALRGGDERSQRLADALRELIAAVKRQPNPSKFQPKMATEFLAASYYEQSLAVPDISLSRALDLAKQAAAISPQSGFAQERVAELEFSFGRTDKALEALNRSLALSPGNPEALALKGFLLAAQSRTREAISWFDGALAVDAALGNAWLGRGLCYIHEGHLAEGRKDLLVAAALEPQRAELRSYLGKAYAEGWDYHHARQELQRAQTLDPNDPTGWLYFALVNQEQNQINEAIRDLEKSEELNDNRSVYRSQLLLDQDQGVRSASLASIYKDAGMPEVSVNEASRAVNYDYGNYSAHLFLADSYDQLSDASGINRRYETPAESEYLVANLLAPVGAGTLSPTLSQGEYSRLFQRDGFGVVSDTEYLSRGAWTQSGAQYGTFGNFNYDFEAFYHSDPGQWANNDIQQRQLSLTVKQQVTPQDSVYLNVQQYEADYGDLSQYYNTANANTTVRVTEKQNPNIAVGYDHEWSPGVHTLFYGTRLNDTASFTNGAAPTLLVFIPAIGITGIQALTMQENYVNRLNIYSGELQQIIERAEHTTVAGFRLQYGGFKTSNLQDSPSISPFLFATPSAQQEDESLFKRISVYGYHQWQIFDPLELIVGLDYDRIIFPQDFLGAPISGSEKTVQQFSPKAGLILTPWKGGAARFAYTRSLAGASVDQSYQIEPAQVAGFIQNYRSIIPESIAGATPGARMATYDLSLEQKFPTGTYLTISGEILDSKVNRVDGAFDFFPPAPPPVTPGGINEDLDYDEKTLQLTVNQLVSRDWSFGLQYRLSRAVLNDDYPNVPASLPPGDIQSQQRTAGTLNQVDMTAVYNHPSGFFVEGEALWYGQSNTGYNPDEPGDDFWQFNMFTGYRSRGRNVEVAIGVLNIAGRNYSLNPLNIYNELPTTRTLEARLQINF